MLKGQKMIGHPVFIKIPNDKFVVKKDSFEDLEIHPTPSDDSFYYFYNKKTRNLVKQFTLSEQEQVEYQCQVILIKKGEKFTPRLAFSIRNKAGEIQKVPATADSRDLKANVNLDKCHDQFWQLISFLQSIRTIEIPKENFSLKTQEESEIINALNVRDPASILSIVKKLSLTEGVNITEADINQLLKRKEKLKTFKASMGTKQLEEKWWQDFFEENKWIFGYGLNYQILKQTQPQATYGGVSFDGKGAKKGDYLTHTVGNLKFTVLVEIKAPDTPLLQGTSEVRNGAWSLSKHLADAVSQISADIATWENEGSQQEDNKDRLENNNIFTVKPKGIIVIGNLGQFSDIRSKRGTFQRFRQSIHGIEILTFDELFERATYIVDEKEEEKGKA